MISFKVTLKMIGFNKIIQVQPGRQPQQARVTSAPLGVSVDRKNIQATPIKRSLPPSSSQEQHRGTPKRPHHDFVTPARRPFLDTSSVQNAPIKKRSIEAVINRQQGNESFQGARKDSRESESMIESDAFLDESVEIQQDYDDESAFPANQQGLYDDGFGFSKSTNDSALPSTSKGKVGFERVNEETVEMGGFVLPGLEKKSIHKSYNWIAGRADGQYRVVLGYNTLFKPKNAVDSTTGEKDFNRWRVVRFENRYKENYPYTEFPAKYLDPLIQALEKAREQHELELKEESTI